ncbi:MAG: hypothetical protein KIS67_03880 [Verrucomicrobiae bacterium]|nr:hypothetical protein [Verrucomicrobiae bacterium]
MKTQASLCGICVPPALRFSASLLWVIFHTIPAGGAAFTDADWISLNPHPPISTGYGTVGAMLADGSGGIYVGESAGSFGGYPFEYQVSHWDGNTWSSLGQGLDGVVFAMAGDGTNLYVAGVLESAGGVPANMIAKWNGTSWSALGSGLNYTVRALAVNGTNLYVGGGFGEAGGAPANFIARWDGTSWHALGAGMNGWVSALLPHGNDLYVGGSFTTAGGIAASNVAKWDGTNWSALGSGMGGGGQFGSSVSALAMVGDNLYAAGYFTMAGGAPANNIAKWNGVDWSALGSGVNDYVDVLTANGNDLYVGGFFSTAGGVPAKNIAKWNGASWSGIPTGYPLYSEGYSLVFSDTNFYVGSGFDVVRWTGSNWAPTSKGLSNDILAMAVNGTNLYVIEEVFPPPGDDDPPPPMQNRILKREGGNWSEISMELDDMALLLAASENRLYVGGFFTSVDGTPASHIAGWDGATWSPLSSGLDAPPELFLMSGTNLYVAGAFSTAGGVPANRIARWDGTAWSALGLGVDDVILGMTASGTDLYIAGNFTTAGGTPAQETAKWDGSTWSSLGAGFAGSGPWGAEVRALAVVGTNLYAGGFFQTAGGVSATNIARWDGNAWHPLGTGIAEPFTSTGGYVLALAAHGNDLYVGGYFTSAGGVPARCIAKWDGNVWSALGSGVDYTIYQLEADNAGHLFIRGDFQFGGTTASPRILQANIGLNLLGGRFANPAYSSLTGFTATFTDAKVGQPYRIQTKPMIAVGDWTDLTNFIYSGPIVISDSPLGTVTNRLYRAVTP